MLLTIFTLGVSGCIGGGTHGSIKAYEYPCAKDRLEEAVMQVIRTTPGVSRDTSLDYLGSSPQLDHDTCWNCPAGANYYNDIKHYVSIGIAKDGEIWEYIFRYFGSAESWKSSANSYLSICYAHDGKGRGGSEGNGGVDWSTPILKRRLIAVFEEGFIAKVDSVLGMKHAEPD